MPKSKRNIKVSLTSTRKKGIQLKKDVVEKAKEYADNYARIFLFKVENMRNVHLKECREEWSMSKFYFGKNKVVQYAFGRTPEEEYKENLHEIGNRLTGQKGLLFTNCEMDQVLRWFKKYSVDDYARTGDLATEDVLLDAGPLEQFPSSMEVYLRDQLGLPTVLKRGIVNLVKDHVVCKKGDVMTSVQTRILKLLGIQMSAFKIVMECMWCADGTFHEFGKHEKMEDDDDEVSDENKNVKRKKNKKQKKVKKVSQELETM